MEWHTPPILSGVTLLSMLAGLRYTSNAIVGEIYAVILHERQQDAVIRIKDKRMHIVKTR
jgi:hypothetical protein